MAVRKSKLKDKALQYGAVGVGVLLADKVGDFLPIDNQLIKDLAPAAVGLALSGQKGFLGDVAGGMIAGAAANIIGSQIPAVTGFTYGGGPIGRVVGAEGGPSTTYVTEAGYMN